MLFRFLSLDCAQDRLFVRNDSITFVNLFSTIKHGSQAKVNKAAGLISAIPTWRPQRQKNIFVQLNEDVETLRMKFQQH